MIGVMVPGVFATSGTITLEDDEFVLYGGNLISFSVIGEITDYTYNPMLEIIHNDKVIQSIELSPSKNILYSVIGLNKNWSSGEYFINLKYKNKILDSKSFNIFRDNKVESKTIIHENMSLIVEPFISIVPNKLILNNNSDETLLISGNLKISKYGIPIIYSLHKPDDTIQSMGSTFPSQDGSFEYVLTGIDKYWSSGKYKISATILDEPTVMTSFVIENDWTLSSKNKHHIYNSVSFGSFETSFDKLDEYTILKITGSANINDSQIKLIIYSDNSIVYENYLYLDGDLFSDSIILHDYETNNVWKAGEYTIDVLIDTKLVHSETFSFDDSLDLLSETPSMQFSMEFHDEIKTLSDNFEIKINERELQEIILTGSIENYVFGTLVDTHIITPLGNDVISHTIAAHNGEYYLPMQITDTWISGDYSAYVTYGTFVDEPLLFSVVNSKLDNSQIVFDKVSSENVIDTVKMLELDHYDVVIDNHKIEKNILFTQLIDFTLQQVPIMIITPDDSVINEFTFNPNTGNLQKLVNIDHTWISGDYFVYYVENMIPNILGTFHITNNVNDDVKTTLTTIPVESPTVNSFEINETVFHITPYSFEPLHFSGTINNYSTGKIEIFIDNKIITDILPDQNGVYSGFILLNESYSKGYHYISTKYNQQYFGNQEFLIETDNYFSLKSDKTILKNDIIESGGKTTMSLSGSISDFNFRNTSPVIIQITGPDSQKFSLSPKAYGFYSHSFEIGSKVGKYTADVMYDEKTIDSFEINVIPAQMSYLKKFNQLWNDGVMSDYSHLQKVLLILDGEYEAPVGINYPLWFAESVQRWNDGSMDDDSFYEMVLFLVENNFK